MAAAVPIDDSSKEVSREVSKKGSNKGSRHSSSVGRQSRNRLQKSGMLPKAGTITLEKTLSKENLLNDIENEEAKKIHIVKHLPKSEEEILDRMIKENSQLATTVRKATKDAK